ncbi:MAG: hypothetical protein H7061_08980 [Bdellovibrionaceae bacterium]|nr:hypothetical protein [Bdellovibrio sp.]
MPISVEARIWLAAHLLYPNSTQAFDVYQAIVAQSERAIGQSDYKYLLIKLSQICEKIPAVNSSLSFHVFEPKPLDEWKIIYRRSQKIQQLIFIGVLIFEMSLEQIANAFKLTIDKTRFLLHQGFKKVVQQTSDEKFSFNFKYKKANDQKVSYLFTNENLIDYTLGILPVDLARKVEMGLGYYPNLKVSANIYEKIIRQIKILVSDNELSLAAAHAEMAGAPPELSMTQERLKVLNQYKKPISISTFSMIVLVLVFIRPRWLENLSKSAKNQAVVLLEYKKIQNPSRDDELENTKPLGPATLAVATFKTITAKKVEPKVVAAVEPPVVSEKPVAKPTNIAHENKKQGGLYRGVLVVTDLDEVTPKIVDKIVNLGGKKAGEVELGWKKSENVGYYHFTIAADSVDEVNEFLKQFGKYKVDFENHPRLLPSGTKRFIIEVKEGE